MQKNLDFLKTLDIHEIQSRTHISMSSLEAILNQSYDKLERIHFSGFISILEREYQVDLSDIRSEYAAFNPAPSVQQPTVAVNTLRNDTPKKENQKGWLLLLLIIIGILAALFFVNKYILNTQKFSLNSEVNNSEINAAKETMHNNATVKPYLNKETDTVHTKQQENAAVAVETKTPERVDGVEVIETQPLAEGEIVSQTSGVSYNDQVTIVPHKKVWIGLIELPSMKKKNIVTSRDVKIDDTKDWLIALGHAEVDIQQDSELLNFKGSKPIYFIYEYGTLRQIDKAEFKELNQGKIW